MTVKHQQRYQNASARNVASILAQAIGTRASHFAGMELDDLKHHAGVRQKDMGYDESLKSWLDKQHASAKKTGVKPTFKKRGGHEPVADGMLDNNGELIKVKAEDETVAKNLLKVAPLPGNAALSDSFGNAEPDDTAPVKKVNPKKLARQQALEKSGTARSGNVSQKVNADAKRAEVMAGKTQRQPRIFAKK